jgi:hypothetical protein
MALTYDDGAFNFFAITLLLLYVIPAGFWIVRRILTWRPPADEKPVVRR